MVVTALDTLSVQLCNLSGSNTGVIAGTFRATVFSGAASIESVRLESRNHSGAGGLPGVRPLDFEALALPLLRSEYVPTRLDLGPSSNWPMVRIRFGYSDGDAAAGEAALIKYASAWADCNEGCSITIMSPPGCVLYYRVERSDDQNSMSRLGAINSVVASCSTKMANCQAGLSKVQ
jgi:hypothetical protein